MVEGACGREADLTADAPTDALRASTSPAFAGEDEKSRVDARGAVWYSAAMTSKTAAKTAAKPAKDKRRRTTMVPVTTMEEIPILSGKERAELIARLKAAQARVKAGKAIDYAPETFKQRLVGIYRKAKR